MSMSQLLSQQSKSSTQKSIKREQQHLRNLSHPLTQEARFRLNFYNEERPSNSPTRSKPI